MAATSTPMAAEPNRIAGAALRLQPLKMEIAKMDEDQKPPAGKPAELGEGLLGSVSAGNGCHIDPDG